MTTIDGQPWQRCVECEALVPAAARNFAGQCPECAPAPAVEDLDQGAGQTPEYSNGTGDETPSI